MRPARHPLSRHPSGAHMGSGEEAGLARVAAGMTRALAETERAMVLLETTAGQGTYLGGTFEHLARLLELTPPEYHSRVGICLDTCHIFVAGYDISTRKGMRRPGPIRPRGRARSPPCPAPQRCQEAARQPHRSPRASRQGAYRRDRLPADHERPAAARPTVPPGDAERRRPRRGPREYGVLARLIAARPSCGDIIKGGGAVYSPQPP